MFTFSGNEADVVFECRVDESPFDRCQPPFTTQTLNDGTHTVAVRARDGAGNIDATPAQTTFVIDTTPPQTELTGKPSEYTNDATPTLQFSASEPALKYECAVDSGSFTPCLSPWTLSALEDGPHAVAVRATDHAGNTDPTPATWQFTVDTVPPQTAIDTGPPSVTSSTGPEYEFSANESGSTFECSLDGAAYAPCTSPKAYAQLADGQHTLAVRATDPAGNTDPTPATRQHRVDTTPPDSSFTSGPSGLTRTKTSQFAFQANETGVSFECSLDGAAFSTCTSPNQLGPLEDGPHTLEVRGTDPAGNQETSPAKRSFTVNTEPLTASPGDAQVVEDGQAVSFDGRGSRPSVVVSSYAWNFGDGQQATGSLATHTYAQPGTYTVTLTVSGMGEQASATTTVTVKPPAIDPGASITITSGGAKLSGAQALIIDAEGVRYSTVSGSDGIARIAAVPDGTYTVYAYKQAYRPNTTTVTVKSGAGSTSVTLEPGEIATATLDSRRLSLEEIVAAGIDPNEPGNQFVYEFEIHLAFTPGGGTPGSGGTGVLSGMVSEGGFIDTHWSGDGSCSPTACQGHLDDLEFSAQVHWVSGQPLLQWLIIPGKARFLKEFFEVSMIVQNLASPAFTLSPGTAQLQLPSGLTLAPTPTPQSASIGLPAIPGQSAQTATWIVRGDLEGDYRLRADYTSTLEPLGLPVVLQAASASTLKVWGDSAIRMRVVADNRAVAGNPYRVRVGLENVADTPVYNASIELLKEGKLNYIYQPRERLERSTAAIQPGETFWGDYILVPAITGKLELRYSFVKKTAGNSSLESLIEQQAAIAPLALDVRARKDAVVLTWESVPEADGYRLFDTADLATDFPTEELGGVQWLAPNKALVPAAHDKPSRLFAVSSLLDRETLLHPVVPARGTEASPYPTAEAGFSPKCGTGDGTLQLRFEDPDFPVVRYEVRTNGTADGTTYELADGETTATVRVTGLPPEGRRYAIRGTNARGESGPETDVLLRDCAAETSLSSAGFKYVALGDSFSAGEGVPPYFEPQNRCHRSTRGYATQVLNPQRHSQTVFTMAPAAASFGHLACSGATTDNVDFREPIDKYETFNGDPLPQLETNRRIDLNNTQGLPVDANTDLVTLTIGGNDLRFSDILGRCATTRVTLNCQQTDVPPGYLVSGAEFGGTVQQFLTAKRAEVAQRVYQILARIKDQAPRAQVLLLGYPQLFPASRAEQACAPLIALWSFSEQRFMRDEVSKTNVMLAAAAGRAGSRVRFVPVEERFSGHEACGIYGSWINPLTLTVGDRSITQKQFADLVASPGFNPDDIIASASFHPNALGHAYGYAAAVNNALGIRTARPRLTLRPTLTAARDLSVNLAVSCPAGGLICAGTVVGTAVRAGGAAAKRRAIVLGRSPYRVGPGKRATVTLRLQRSQVRKAAGNRRTLRATIAVQDLRGSNLTRKRVTLRVPRPTR